MINSGSYPRSRLVWLRGLTCLTLLLWIALQCGEVLTLCNIPEISDGGAYLRTAMDCIRHDSFYPMACMATRSCQDSTYLAYPGYINLLILVIKATGCAKYMYWLNVAFNCLLVASVSFLTRHFAGRLASYLATILICFGTWSIMAPCMLLTELPSMALSMFALCLLCFKKPRFYSAGIVAATAFYIRSTSLLFSLAAIIWFALGKTKKPALKYTLSLLATMFAFCALNYSISHGKTFFANDTLGINIFLGANPTATGYYDAGCLASDNLDERMQGKSTAQCDSIYRDISSSWISQNPGQWLSLAPLKVRGMFDPDFIQTGFGKVADRNNQPGLLDLSRYPLLFMWWNRIYYYFLWGSALLGLILMRKRMRLLISTLIPWIAGIFLAILTIGSPRYNQPYLPIAIFYASTALAYLIRRLLQREINPVEGQDTDTIEE